jgi:hypothetical protein
VPTNVILFPHSPKEFKNASELAHWLKSNLKVTGEYLVATVTPGYKRVSTGSLVLFHKDKHIVGEAVATGACRPYKGTTLSPVTGAPYEGVITFEPSSVRCYASPISLGDASRLTGKNLIPQGVRELETDECEKLFSELACPVCRKEPCIKEIFFNQAMDLYRNACEEGVVMCPQCGSVGHIEKTTPCWRCRKQGYPPPGGVCPVCKNRGYVGLGIEKCPLCGGIGEVSPTKAADYRIKSAA